QPEQPQQQPQPAQPPKGIDLVPTRPPTDIFRPPPPPQPPSEETPPPGGQASQAPPIVPETPAIEETDLAANETAGGPAAVAHRAGAGGIAPAASSAAPAPAVAKAGFPAVEGAQGGAAVQLWVNPKGVEVAPGDRFTVRLEASALDPVSHLPLTLAYDPKVLA